MPELNDYEELDMTFMNVDNVQSTRSILRADYGDGYADTTRNGAAGGRKLFTLSAGVWPDNENQPLIGTQTIFDYYWSFFEERLDNGNEPFVIEWRDRKWLVEFAEPQHGVDVHTADLFTPNGIALKTRRVNGMTFSTDGSVFDPSMLEPYLWGRFRDADDFPATLPFPWVSAWENEIDANTHSLEAGATDVIVATNQLNGYAALRLSSTTNDGFLYDINANSGGEPTIYDAWFVMKMREATFSNFAGILTAGTTIAALVGGGPGTTYFFNQGFGSSYSYEKNNVAFPESSQQAPMNTFGVVHIRFENGIVLEDLQIGKDRDLAGRFAELDIVEFDAMDSLVPAIWAEAFNRWLMSYYAIV